MTVPVRDNTAANRYELEIDGTVVFASYHRNGGTLHIRHVEAPPALRGTGAAGRLMQGIMDAARAQHLRVVPWCGYAAHWIRRHRDCSDLLA